ncbi:sigma-70 family RNA polymerase sigma factor [Aeribacillus composti]|uniref:RNA polymerase sigma factor n=1 Tax=Aeribacillus composti TaxID=1868734 RepID=UPI002E2219E1|nr:sigma-70 family RNA polymerase sigma factor [Aeribacillus composti]
MDQEKKWIKAIQKRASEKAANKLISYYYKEIYAFVFKQTFDQELAKDLTQEIFISMLRGIHHYEGKAAFRTWLYKIARARIIDYYRSKEYKQQKKTVNLLTDQRESDDVLFTIEQKDEVKQVLNLLERFDHENRRIVQMKIFAGQTFAEIAAKLQIKESTVKTKYYSTLRKINEQLKEDVHGH